MPLSAEDLDRTEAFRSYVEDYIGNDDRFDRTMRADRPEKMWFATRFEVAPTCWFELAVMADVPQIRYAFLTSDGARMEAVEQTIEDSGGSPEQYLAGAFAEAGLDWADPQVEHLPEDNLFCYATFVKLDELRDLDSQAIRDNTLRIFEGFVIAFAPALMEDEIAE